MSPSSLAPNPYLKLSGIAAVLAEVTSERKAKEVLEDVWSIGAGSGSSSSAKPVVDGWASQTLTEEERLRRVALACKLAELSSGRNEEEERWLVWAVEEVLKLVGPGVKNKSADERLSQSQLTLADLRLPPWMSKDDLGAPLAALGDLYSRTGKTEYVMRCCCPLLVISTVHLQLCHGALLASHLASVTTKGGWRHHRTSLSRYEFANVR